MAPAGLACIYAGRAYNQQRMKKFLSKRNLFAAAVLVAAIALAVYLKAAPRLAPGQAPMTDIESIDTLREQFNRDSGQVRLVILVSPT